MALAGLGRTGEALTEIERAEEILSHSFGESSVDVLEVKRLHAVILGQSGQQREAHALLVAIVDDIARGQPDREDTLADALFSLGELELQMGMAAAHLEGAPPATTRSSVLASEGPRVGDARSWANASRDLS